MAQVRCESDELAWKHRMGGQEGTRDGAMKNVFVKIFGAGLCLQALVWLSFPEVERGAVVVGSGEGSGERMRRRGG